MSQVLNFHDAVVYDTDVELFGQHGWLNDNCINWFFRHLEHEVYQGRDDILFMDPAVVSCMIHQCEDAEELADLGRGIGLSSRRMVFVPINNAEGRLSRGTHWSLLVYEAEIESRENSVRFRHFDSSRGHNREAAEQTAAQFVRMLQAGECAKNQTMTVTVDHVNDAPQQKNGYDCGMYTVLVAERLASRKESPVDVASSSRSNNNPSTAAATPTITPYPPATNTSSGCVLHSAVEEGDARQDESEKQRKRKAPPGVKSEFPQGVDVRGKGGSGDSGNRHGGGRDDDGLGEVSANDITPDSVSEARRVARERLIECIRADRSRQHRG